MAINLDRIGKTVARYMLDAIVVERPPQADSDFTINPTTLKATATSTVVYRGKAMLAALGSPAGTNVGGNVPVARLTYEVAIPLGTEDIQPNDVVTVSTSRDPQLQGKRLIVTGTIPTSLVTHRRLAAYLDVGAQ